MGNHKLHVFKIAMFLGTLKPNIDNVRRKQRILHNEECSTESLANSNKYF
jgi:hypothetical protein